MSLLDRVPAALLCALIAIFLLASGVKLARSQEARSGATGTKEEGIASVYGAESGSRRADGQPFHPAAIGCAHKTRRLGSVVTVTVLATGRSLVCPINDRGPYIRGRILDLSVGAARALGVRGLARVKVE